MGFLSKETAYSFEKLELSEIDGDVPDEIQGVWVSKVYMVRHYLSSKQSGSERLSIDYTVPEVHGSVNTITWESLQYIKNTLGFADRYAVELFPPADEEIHSIEQRHLWLVGAPDFGLSAGE